MLKIFLISWPLMFVSLLTAEFFLSWVAERFETDFGVDNWAQEILLAAVVSLLQAGVIGGVFALVGDAAMRAVVIIPSVVLWGFYRVAHYDTMEARDVTAIAIAQWVVMIGLGLLLRVLLAH